MKSASNSNLVSMKSPTTVGKTPPVVNSTSNTSNTGTPGSVGNSAAAPASQDNSLAGSIPILDLDSSQEDVNSSAVR